MLPFIINGQVCSLHMNSNFQMPTHNNASFVNTFDNEKIDCTSTYSMIHKFLDTLKIMDYENTIYYITPNQNFHPLRLFKNKHSNELKFSTLFYGQP
jgi:hypothetical protein